MHQKRASDLITDGCEPPCGCWDLNSRPLEEQLELLTTEPSLQSPLFFFFFFFSLYSTGCPETHFVDQAGRDPLFILKGFILPCEKEDSYYLGFFFFFWRQGFSV